VAASLHIPVNFLPADQYGVYERREQLQKHTSELIHRPISLALSFDQYALASSHCRVVLFGEGPDNALGYEWRAYVSRLFQNHRWGQLGRALGAHARYRAVPFVKGLGGRFQRLRAGRAPKPAPQWIRPDILKLASPTPAATASYETLHPFRPGAYRSLTTALWRGVFEAADAGSTSFPIEVCHPYMDLRVVKYFLSVPPIPWCQNKHLLRRSLCRSLPHLVSQRPKTPLQQDPLLATVKTMGLPEWNPDPELFKYVHPEMVNEVLVRALLTNNSEALWESLRPVSLNYFLLSSRGL
jgi:asparagine synthase (glutamine-hydrolysing)